MGEPPLSGVDHITCITLPLRTAVTAGAAGTDGSGTGSKAANMRRPPAGRAMLPREGDGFIVARDHFGEGRVLHRCWRERAHVLIVRPRVALIVRDGDVRVSVFSLVAEIDRADRLPVRLTDIVRADADGRIDEEAGRAARRYGLDRP